MNDRENNDCIAVEHAPEQPRGNLSLALLFVLFGLCCTARAQQFEFRPYSPAEGLTNLAVGHLAHSANGDLWIGTDGGLFRYDGTSFDPVDTRNGLPPDQVGGVQTDPWGGVWVNLVRGLYTRPPGATRFEPVRAGAQLVRADFRTPLAFLAADRTLVLSDGQVLELRRHLQTWTVAAYLTSEAAAQLSGLGKVRRLLLSGNGTLWLTCGKQICSISNDNLRVWREADGVPADDWNSYLEDPRGRLWVRSPQHLLLHEPNSQAFASHDPPGSELEEIRDNPALLLDPQGRLLVRTGDGLARWDESVWRQFTAANGLPTASISDAQLDAEGNIWLGMNGLGVWRWLNYDYLESWTRAQGMLSEKVWALLRDPNGRLLLGTSSGCQMLDERAALVVPCPVEGLPRRALRAMAVDRSKTTWWGFNNGEIWSSRPGDTRARLVFAESSGRTEISAIYFDSSGTGWIASLDGGLFQLEPQTAHLRQVPLPGGPARIYDITEDIRGNPWIAGSSGLYRKDTDHWSLHTVKDPTGIPTVFDSVAATPDGSVWGSSDGRGLLNTSATHIERKEWVQADIVARTSIYFVRTDTRGWLWLGTDQGVIVYDGRLWRRIDQEDGLIWNDTQVYGFLADRDGSVWIGTSAGLTHIRNPQQLMSPPQPLDLSIARAQLGHATLNFETKTVLPWRADAAFDVHLSSHSFSRSSQTEFRYRLIGLSSSWFGSRNAEIHLPALDAGNYTLEAIAVDTPHARSSRIRSLSFEVLPPWWRSWIFRIACICLLLTGAVSGWRWQFFKLRTRRLALEAEFRERQILMERATRDALTGLWNRVTLLDVLDRETNRAKQTAASLIVGLIDVDHFKLVNDNHGHLAGDEVLRTLARRLTAQLRQADWLGRYGGEEFMMVLPGATYEEARSAAERIRTCVSGEPFLVNGQSLNVTISIGVACFESAEDIPDAIIKRADIALYEAKRSGRNRVAYSMETEGTDPHATQSGRFLRTFIERVQDETVKRKHDTGRKA